VSAAITCGIEMLASKHKQSEALILNHGLSPERKSEKTKKKIMCVEQVVVCFCLTNCHQVLCSYWFLI